MLQSVSQWFASRSAVARRPDLSMPRPRQRSPLIARSGTGRCGWLGVLLTPAVALAAPAAPDPTLMGLEQLMAIQVVAASKYAQPQAEVAATVLSLIHI